MLHRKLLLRRDVKLLSIMSAVSTRRSTRPTTVDIAYRRDVFLPLGGER